MGLFIDAFYDQRNMVQENIKIVDPMVKKNAFYDQRSMVQENIKIVYLIVKEIQADNN